MRLPLPSWFKRKENILVLSFALATLILHLVIIGQVDSLMFDENHYVPPARAIIQGEEPGNLEHPPLGKLFIAAGIEVFGDNPWGWRFFSIVFGTASILLFYCICKQLTRRRWLPVLATFIFAFDNQSFVQSHVAMLDVYSVTFMLGAFFLYLRGNYASSGVVLALSTLAKMTGALAGIVIVLHWFVTRWDKKREGLLFILGAGVGLFALMPLFDYLMMGELQYPWDRIDYMRDRMSSLTFSSTDHDQATHPWEWILSMKPLCIWYKPTYWSAPSWTVWALIIPAIASAIYGVIKRSQWCLFALAWFAGIYLSLIAIDLITDRIMFRFYFYLTLGAVCLALGFAAHWIWTRSSQVERPSLRWAIRVPVMAFFVAHIVVFAIMSPYTNLGWTLNCG